MRFSLLLSLASLFLLVNICQAQIPAPYYLDRERGWYWYEIDEIVEEEVEEIIEGAKENAPISASEILVAQGEAWEAARNEAVLNPSFENITIYLELTEKINRQAEVFSDAFQQAIWRLPEYDQSVQGRPINTQALFAYSETQNDKQEQILSEIAETKGIFYFFRSDCPYCARFSPILKRFAEHYGFELIGISMDGPGVLEFPNPKINPVLAKKLNVSVVPAFFLVDPRTNTIASAGLDLAIGQN